MQATSLAFNLYLFASPLVFMLLYVWSREFPTSQVPLLSVQLQESGCLLCACCFVPHYIMQHACERGSGHESDLHPMGISCGHLHLSGLQDSMAYSGLATIALKLPL